MKVPKGVAKVCVLHSYEVFPLISVKLCCPRRFDLGPDCILLLRYRSQIATRLTGVVKYNVFSGDER